MRTPVVVSLTKSETLNSPEETLASSGAARTMAAVTLADVQQLRLRGEVDASPDVLEVWKEFLRGPRNEPVQPRSLDMLDLFSGVGGLALGFRRAAAERGVVATSRG